MATVVGPECERVPNKETSFSENPDSSKYVFVQKLQLA